MDETKCRCCGKPLTEKQIKQHRKYCSRQCGGADKQRRETAKQTWITKYGTDHPWKNEAIKQKITATNIERYGAAVPITSDIVLAKRRQTNLERYNAEMPFQSESIQNKAAETIKAKYSVDNVSEDDVILAKRVATSRSNGYQRYCDVLSAMHNITLLSTKQQFIENDTLEFKCNRCQSVWTQSRRVAQKIICDNCRYFVNKDSVGESQLVDFIRSIVGDQYDIQLHNRSVLDGQEIDVYIEHLKLGFEFNGCYWHSDLFLDNDYHQLKISKANERGVVLIHIFENEWNDDNDRIKQKIAACIKTRSRAVKIVYNTSAEPAWCIRSSEKSDTYKRKYSGDYNDVIPQSLIIENQGQYELTQPQIIYSNPQYNVYGCGNVLI